MPPNVDLWLEKESSLIGGMPKTFCDIGAGDGVPGPLSGSNTHRLASAGWGGLCVEMDGESFGRLARQFNAPCIRLLKTKITPHNAWQILSALAPPEDIGFLSIDIDGYDYEVLDILLSKCRPRLVCCEINEKIPPPLKFFVKYSPSYAWGCDHFYGFSVSMLDDICAAHGYGIIDLDYHNAFLVPNESCAGRPRLAAADAYRRGYLGRPDRKACFPWNADVERLITMGADEALAAVVSMFRKYEGQFSLRG